MLEQVENHIQLCARLGSNLEWISPGVFISPDARTLLLPLVDSSYRDCDESLHQHRSMMVTVCTMWSKKLSGVSCSALTYQKMSFSVKLLLWAIN
jgi:hypothetical protein